ncbi:hypothetical protein C3L33_00652, partial [Rhododendron williamsianum]
MRRIRRRRPDEDREREKEKGNEQRLELTEMTTCISLLSQLGQLKFHLQIWLLQLEVSLPATSWVRGGFVKVYKGLLLVEEDHTIVLPDEDRISTLPDDVLSSIISRLTFRDSVKTSILSSKWRYLCAAVSDINFDIEVMFGPNGNTTDIPNEREIDVLGEKDTCTRLCRSLDQSSTFDLKHLCPDSCIIVIPDSRYKINGLINGAAKLGVLVVDACPGLEEIELNAINLTTFECCDPSMKKFSFSCVPN